MSSANATATTSEPKAPKAKKVKAPKASSNGNGDAPQYGMDRSHDLPWHDKKVSVFKALKALKATSVTGAQPAGKIAAKAGLTEREVRHYVYHAKAAGLTGVAAAEEGGRGYTYYLTAKGAAIDPVKAQKEEQAAKAVK